MAVGARWATVLSVSHTADLLRFVDNYPNKREYPSSGKLCGGKHLVDVKGQRSELTDLLETIERQQQLPITTGYTTKVCRIAF